MISPSDLCGVPAGVCPVQVVFIGVQEGAGIVPDFPLYNVERQVGEVPVGATLGLSTLRKMGWSSPEPLVVVRAHPVSGWTHAWLERPGVSSCRVYRGSWATEEAATAALPKL